MGRSRAAQSVGSRISASELISELQGSNSWFGEKLARIDYSISYTMKQVNQEKYLGPGKQDWKHSPYLIQGRFYIR